jgi:hypothetical protein
MMKLTSMQPDEGSRYVEQELPSNLTSVPSQDCHFTSSDGLPSIPVTLNPNTSNPNPSTDEVFELERIMLTMPQVEVPTKEYFAPGIYAREITLPAGSVATGYVHKYPQLNILSKGTIQVRTEDGIKTVEAPFTVVSPAGTKRVAYAVTECVWTTILQTNLIDYEEIKKIFVCQSEEEYKEWLSLQVQLSPAQDSHFLP